MTDPFKNQNFSYSSQSKSSPTLSNPYNPYNPRPYSYADRKFEEPDRYEPNYSYATSRSLATRRLNEEEDTMPQYPQYPVSSITKNESFLVRKTDEEQNIDFVKNYIETNRESIVQLRSYIELLFKGVRY